MSHKWLWVCLLEVCLALPALAQEVIPLGNNLTVAYERLEPLVQYDVALRDENGRYVSMLRVTADARGAIPEHVLLYQSGVVGCSRNTDAFLAQPYRYRTFDEAARGLAGHVFTVELQRTDSSVPLARRSVAFRDTGAPLVYFSNSEGCLLNGVGGADEVFVTARNVGGVREAEVYVVAEQARWERGDAFGDQRGLAEPQRVRLDERQTSFTVPVWSRGEMRSGAYDVIVRPRRSDGPLAIDGGDFIGWPDDTGIVLTNHDGGMGGGDGHLHEQIAGRFLDHAPWFDHVDGMLAGSDVYGGFDPLGPPLNAGPYAAWYVVKHKSSWQQGDALVDVSGGAEIMPIKGGCINSVRALLWSKASPSDLTAAQPQQHYDVVVDFGTWSNNVFVSNQQYDHGVDLLDDGSPAGFVLMRDPALPGSYGTHAFGLPKECTIDLTTRSLTWSDPTFYPNDPAQTITFDPDDWPAASFSGCQTPLLDMTAQVYVPTQPGSTSIANGMFPVVVILHGQQAIPTLEAYLGFDWLGRLLASHGFVVYSIDGRCILDASVGSKGQVIREHLQRLVQLNAANSGSPLSQHLDMSRVALLGHSRGGDAVVAAWEWNRVQPDNGYALRALIGISPTALFGDAYPQLVAADLPFHPPHIRDIPYLVIAGSYETDAGTFPGLMTYDRAGDPRLPGHAEKAMVYIKRANHNYFNEIWETQPGNDTPNLPVLQPAEQRETAKVYVHAALEAWLNGRSEYVDFLRGVIRDPTTTTESVDHQFADSLYVDDYQTNFGDLALSSSNGQVASIDFDVVKEFMVPTTAPTPERYYGDTRALFLRWTKAAYHELEVTPAIRAAIDPAVHRALAMRIGQSADAINQVNPELWFELRLVDTTGTTSPWIPSTQFSLVPAAWDTPADQQMNSAYAKRVVMSMVRMPLDAFTNCSVVDATKLARIEMRFGKEGGQIILDDVRFTK